MFAFFSLARKSAPLVALLAMVTPSQADTVVESVIAKLLAQALINSQFNVDEGKKTVLDINAQTNEMRELQLLGSTFSISACHEMIVATTNFRNEKGEVTSGNYVLQMQGDALHIVYQSFGDDHSLDRIQNSDCKTVSFGGPLLRPTIIAIDD